MRNRLMMVLVAISLALTLSSVVLAQQPPLPGGNRGPGFGAGMRSGPNQYNLQLMRTTRQITELNKDMSTALTASQSKSILAVLKPLRDKPKLTGDKAKLVAMKLQKVFTLAQRDAIGKMRSRPRQGQGAGPGGPGMMPGGPQGGPQGTRPGRRQGPGMGGPGMMPGGPQGRLSPAAMKDFNPFYTKAAKGDNLGQRRAQRIASFFSDLEKRAKGR